MEYQTKVMLTALAKKVGQSQSVQEAYEAVVSAASEHAMLLPKWEELLSDDDDIFKE